jgi:hypothetical protein
MSLKTAKAYAFQVQSDRTAEAKVDKLARAMVELITP